MWQLLVPMITTIVPGCVTVAAGADTCASTFATATGVPGRRPVSAAARSVRTPGAGPERRDRARQLLVDDVLEARVECGEIVVGREAVALRPHRLVAGSAAVAGLDAGELPDDPVGGLDEAVGARVDLGRLVEDLERLREEPLGRDPAAVARQPRLAALGRDGVDAVGLRLRGVVLPELDPRVRVAAQVVEQAERCSVGGRRQHRAGREVDPDPDHVARVDVRFGEHRRHGVLERAQVVLRVLQRPVRLELDVRVRLR